MSVRNVEYSFGVCAGSSSNESDTSSDTGCPSTLLTLISSFVPEPSMFDFVSTTVLRNTGYSSIPVANGTRMWTPGSSGCGSTPPPARWITMPTLPGLMYVNVDGSRNSAAISTITPKMMRFSFRPASAPRSNCIEPRRSDIVLGIDDLLVAFRAHLRSAREAHQLVFGMTAVDDAHQFGRALDALSILRLADSDAHWCEVHDDPIKKGATRRDQRDEKHPFHYDGTHWFALSWRGSARRRCTQHYGAARPAVSPRRLRCFPAGRTAAAASPRRPAGSARTRDRRPRGASRRSAR